MENGFCGQPIYKCLGRPDINYLKLELLKYSTVHSELRCLKILKEQISTSYYMKDLYVEDSVPYNWDKKSYKHIINSWSSTSSLHPEAIWACLSPTPFVEACLDGINLPSLLWLALVEVTLALQICLSQPLATFKHVSFFCLCWSL